MASRDAEIKRCYEAYGSLVFRRCHKILGSEDEAWDVTQEVFIKLMDHMNKINPQALLSWLYTVSTNRCISVLRKKRSIAFEEEFHGAETQEEQSRQKVLLTLVEKYLKPWDKKVRLAVIYTYIDGYSQSEAAKLLDIGESTLRRYLTEFKRKSKMTPPENLE